MNLNQITVAASALIGKEIDSDAAEKIVYECINIIAALYETACPVFRVDILCGDTSEYYSLPNNRGIIRVLAESGAQTPEYEYNACGIRFNETGNFKIYLYKADFEIPENANGASELEINPRYHAEILKYLAYKILQVKDPGSQAAPKLLDEFFSNIKAINASFGKKRFPSKIPARDWR
jgi:hypothetical protein